MNRSSFLCSVAQVQMRRVVTGTGPAHSPPPQISWVSAGKQGELQRRQGLPTPSPAGAPTLAPALTRSSNEFYLSCGVLSATSAVDQTKRLYRCSAVIHFSAKGRSIRSSQRALGELGRKELKREIRTLCVSEPRERRSPWRGSPDSSWERPGDEEEEVRSTSQRPEVEWRRGQRWFGQRRVKEVSQVWWENNFGENMDIGP